MTKHTKEPMKVGDGYTSNDGNFCEDAVTITRVAEKYSGDDKYYGDANHAEFELSIQTPWSNNAPDDAEENEEGGYEQKLTLSRANLQILKGLLSGMDLSQDPPVNKMYEDF